ncbi:hypothetical protein AWG36_17930 [Escherichia coli]|nr:hypothetical protein AWG36_17930 [Escherichia coli]
MLPSETMIWQPEFTDKTLSRKPGAVHFSFFPDGFILNRRESECPDNCLLPYLTFLSYRTITHFRLLTGCRGEALTRWQL